MVFENIKLWFQNYQYLSFIYSLSNFFHALDITGL